MDGALRVALDALVDYLFTDDEPTPAELGECRRSLPETHLNLASLFLNLRLMVRWRDFGVSHSAVRVPTAEPDTVTFEVRVYDPQEMREPIEYGMRRAGFTDLGYRNELGGMGGWVRATVPQELIQRLQG